MNTTLRGLDAVSIITEKRDGGELSAEQIDWVIEGFTRGVVAPEQMAALAMAVCLRGMSSQEIARWTTAMVASGTRWDFSDVGRPTVDKHSTGGVGDKITLPLVPLVAACGAAVPQMSGRGLGHTGGTLDKLESIPGWSGELALPQIRGMLADQSVGAAIFAAGAEVAPADRLLYALRDVTGTVESIPLIASSIMSKKIAEGVKALVLDVKVGSGAFMKTVAEARELATTMTELGGAAGVRTSALLTDMNTPLGFTAGNALEVAEAVEVLSGGGPADVVALTLALARDIVAAAGLDVDPAPLLASGRAMDHWQAMIRAQGGDPAAPLPVARHCEIFRAPRSGVVTGLDAMGVGRAAWHLGAGRSRPGQSVQPGAGVQWTVRPGDSVSAGQPVCTLHTDTPTTFPTALAELAEAMTIAENPPPAPAKPIVLERIPHNPHS